MSSFLSPLLLSTPSLGSLIKVRNSTTLRLYFDLIKNFSSEGEPEVRTLSNEGELKGIIYTSLPKPWQSVASWLMRCFTSNGKFSIVLGPIMILLIHLRHGHNHLEYRVNLSHFVSSYINTMANR